MDDAIYVERRDGDEAPVLLLHGLGCNGAVWDPVVEILSARGFGVVVPDFPGHGRSSWRDGYSAGQYAAAVSELVPKDRAVHVIGHSLGGAVALLLASGLFGIKVASTLAIGMKVRWTKEEVERFSKEPPMRIFAEREDAARRFLRTTGLDGICDVDDRSVACGIVPTDGGFRLATDPKTVMVTRASISRVPSYGQDQTAAVRFCCGADDKLVDLAALRELDPRAVSFEGHGHNVHVSAPLEIVNVFTAMAAETGVPTN